MKRSVLALAMGLIAITAMAKTIKTTVFTTSPQMHCENCENKIKGNLRFEKGVKKIVTDIDSQTVTVTGNLPDSQIGIGYFSSCCNSSGTSVNSVEPIRIYVVRQAGRTTDTGNDGNIVRSYSQFGHSFVQ